MTKPRKFEPPFQLWADLHCGLRPLHPVEDAAVLVKEREDQIKLGILRLCDCHEEAPRG